MRRSTVKYDVIQASLVDTWAATAAGAYTLTENTLYTVEAFNDYLDHLTDDGVLTITRWVFDGLRLVSLAQAAWKHAAGGRRAPRRHPARTGGDVPAQEVAVHARRSRDARTVSADTGLPRAVRPWDEWRSDTEAEELVDGTARVTTRGSSRRTIGSASTTLPAGHPADHRRPSVLLSHDEARTPVSGGVRTVDAVRQRPERPPHPDGDLRTLVVLFVVLPLASTRTATPGRLASVARLLRRPRRGLHAD